ncbi:acyltransferase family protein [Mucilaginibacter sp. McL0603]|uniref:acyltransferase family protein n=1 Tax=Mucilaginibacter sp. McL0603 TaxID=3415670 RepID=UPI003CF89813
MTLPNTKNRNHLIDLLRFVSACWVVLFHFNEPVKYIDNWYRNFCKLGYLGVPVFFIISGFCIRIAQKHVKTPNEFIIKRLFRIFPPYWMSLAIVITCAMIIKVITGYNSTPLPKNISGIAATLFLYTEPVSHFATVNWVYWTLPYELSFYFIIGLSIFASKRFVLVLPLVLTSIAILLPIQKENFLFFFNELPSFLLGYSLCILIHKDENKWLNALLFLLSVAGLILKHLSFEYLLTCFLTVTLIYINSKKTLKENTFSRMGDFSYSIYLLHVPLGIYLLGFIKNKIFVQQSIIINMVVDLSLLAGIVFVSKLTFQKIEAPSIELGKKFSKYSLFQLKSLYRKSL